MWNFNKKSVSLKLGFSQNSLASSGHFTESVTFGHWFGAKRKPTKELLKKWRWIERTYVPQAMTLALLQLTYYRPAARERQLANQNLRQDQRHAVLPAGD
jgi:hypothetical protein